MSKLYDALILILIFAGVTFVGYIYLNRASIFKAVTDTFTGTTVPEGFVSTTPLIASNWVSSTQNIRGESFLIKEGFNSIVYGAGLNSPRMLIVVDENVVVSEPERGNVVVLKDIDFDNSADNKFVFASGLQKPYGLSYYENDLYVALENKVIVYRDFLAQLANNTHDSEDVVSSLPIGGLNPYKSLVVGPESKIFVSIGSSCNDCVDPDKRRASIVTYNLDGSGEEIYAAGLRNTKDFTFVRGSFYAIEESISADNVQNELNNIQRSRFYGWPYYVNDSEPYNNMNSSLSPSSPKTLFDVSYNPTGILYTENTFKLPELLLVSINTIEESSPNKVLYQSSDSTTFKDFIIFDSNTGIYAKPSGLANYNRGVLISDSLNGVIYYVY